jgi:AcrR family transcriptional regulator
MPKIHAPSVREHREAQQKAIVAAARAMILDVGFESLSFSELSNKTGLARTSLYEYFRTKHDLAVALISEEASLWQQAVAARIDHKTPQKALGSFVLAVLDLVRSGQHELAFALADGSPNPTLAAAINSAHRNLFQMVIPALTAMGVRDLETCVEMIGGVIMTAGQALRRNRKRRGISELAVAFVVGGARACAKAETSQLGSPHRG